MLCNLQIHIAKREDRSYLKDAFVTTPFRIVPVGQYRKDKAAYLMIMSSSPGLLDGDEHVIEVTIDPGAKLQLQTQAFQRLFQMKGHASQTTKVKVNEGAVFSYVPHPIVPQNASSFLSHNVIEMQDNCHTILSDIITCGRKMTGEVFKYNQFQNLTECFVNGTLIVKDNVLLKPTEIPINEIGFLEGYTHQGTFVYLNSAKIPVEELIETLYDKHHPTIGIEFGISKLQTDGFIIRVLGNEGEAMFKLFKEIEAYLWDTLLIPYQSTTQNNF